MQSPNERIFDVIHISNIVCDIFKEEELFEYYKNQLINFKMDLIINNYNLADLVHKDKFFDLIKDDFLNLNNIFNKEDFLLNLNSKNIKIHSNALIAKNSKEFDLLNDIDYFKLQNRKLKLQNDKLGKKIIIVSSSWRWKLIKFWLCRNPSLFE